MLRRVFAAARALSLRNSLSAGAGIRYCGGIHRFHRRPVVAEWAILDRNEMEGNDECGEVRKGSEGSGTTGVGAEEETKPLPKLSPQDFRTYNHMAEHMELFHNHFRQTYSTVQTACATNTRPAKTSIRAFLALASQFCSQLNLHHNIEETHIFPVLATRMPAFQKELELLSQHKVIHAGIEKLEGYVQECRDGGRELRLEEMGEILGEFGEVLWAHLDDEVEALGAENMRKFWTREEMRRMPM